MKIAIIEPVGNHGGMNYYDYGIVEGLSLSDIEPWLFTQNVSDFGISQSKVFLFFNDVYKNKNLFTKIFLFYIAFFKSLSVIKKNKIQIIHFHFFSYGFLELVNILLSKTIGCKIVITLHDIQSFANINRIIRFGLIRYLILKMSNSLIVHNNYSKEYLLKSFSKLDTKINVIHHGSYVNQVSSLVDKSYAKSCLSIPLKKKVILFFGQIKTVKGLDLLLKALSVVKNSNQDILLLIAGKTWKDEIDYYTTLISSLGLSDNVLLHIRYIKDEEVSLYYSASDLVVLPYREIFQSGVLLMAMSFKKPVLVSDLPGMTEIIQHGNNGLVFSNNNYFDLASKILFFFENDSMSEKMVYNAYKLLLTEYSWKNIGKQLSSLYFHL